MSAAGQKKGIFGRVRAKAGQRGAGERAIRYNRVARLLKNHGGGCQPDRTMVEACPSQFRHCTLPKLDHDFVIHRF